MALTTAAVVAAGASAYGAYSSSRASSRAADAQNRALSNSQTQLNPFAVSGLNGMGASWSPTGFSFGTGGPTMGIDPAALSGLGIQGLPLMGPGGGVIGSAMNQYLQSQGGAAGQIPVSGGLQLQGGNLDPISAALSQYAGTGVPSFSNQLPPGVQQALTQFQGAQGIPSLDLQGLDSILGGANNAFTQAQQGLATAGQISGFNPSSIFGNANAQFDSLGQTYDQAYGNTLNTLREQARPEEERAFAGLTDNLFSTGRLGSTGGALQTEAFARGLGQADLSRQLAAGQEGRLAQQNALGLGQGLFGVGAQGMSLQDQLINSAFGRFGQTAQMSADLNQSRFARSMYGNELGYTRAQNMLGTQTTLAGLPASLQGAQLGNVNAALQGQSGIQAQLLQLFGAGLSAEQAAANARIGAGSNMAQIVGNPSFGAAGQANAAMWSQLGSSLMNQNGLGGVLGNLFNQQQVQSPDAWGALDQALASGQVTG